MCSAHLTCTPWHIEDLALSSLNHLLLGAAKIWFLAPTEEAAGAFYALLKREGRLDDFRNKTVQPHELSIDAILDCGLVPLVQVPGESIITAPGYSAVHVTVSGGFSAAVSGNCYFSSSKSFLQFLQEQEQQGVGSDGAGAVLKQMRAPQGLVSCLSRAAPQGAT